MRGAKYLKAFHVELRTSHLALRIRKMKLSKAIRSFLEHCEIEKHQSQKTLENYTHYLERFLTFATDLELDALDLPLIKKYRLFLNRYEHKPGKPLTIKTQNYHIIALRAFLKYCIKQDWKTLEPEKIELGKIPDRTVEYLDRDELERLFEAVDTSTIVGLRNRAILEFLYSTGLRISELVGLDCKQVNLERGEFQVRGKGQKMRIVFLSDRAKEWITDYMNMRDDGFEPLFLNHRRARKKKEGALELHGEHRRLTAYTIQEMVRKTAYEAGIVKKVTPHVLRHSFATELLINGADIRSVQDMLGHASITTTQIYTHLTNKKLKEIHEKFHK